MKLGFLVQMRHVFLLLPCALLLASLSPARALDCAKVSSKAEKLICTTPELKSADEAMSDAYFRLLRQTSDPEFHAALIMSQRRWLEVRASGPDRFGAAENNKTDDREVLLQVTRDRLKFLQTAEPVRIMAQEREIMSKDGGGSFAGYKSYCVLQPPPYGSWEYQCWGEVHRQHSNRICSSVMEWSSGHMTENRSMRVLKNGKPQPVATCSTGYASTNEQCPEPDDDPQTRATSHWNTNPNPVPDDSPTLGPGKFSKYDPDVGPEVIKQSWMQDCLFAPVFPPHAE